MQNLPNFSIMNSMQEHSSTTHRFLPWIHTLQEYTLYGLVLSSALFLLPVTPNLFDGIKVLTILLLSAFSLLLWTLQTVFTRQISITIHPLLLPLGLYLGSLVVSSILTVRHPIESFAGLPGMTVALLVITLITTQLVRQVSAQRFVDFLLGLSVFLTVVAFLQMLGMGPSLMLNAVLGLELPHNFAFNFTGSPLITLTILVTAVVATFSKILAHRKQFSILRFAGVSIVGLGILAHLFLMHPGKEFQPFLLPLNANWSMAADTLKTVRSALFGFGPASFTEAYSVLRPVSINATRSWNVLYEAGTNTPLTYLVTLGLVGFGAWFFLVTKSIWLLRSSPAAARPAGLVAVTSLILQFFVPLNIPLAVIQFVAIMFWLSSLRAQEHTMVSDLTLKLNATARHKEYGSSGILSYGAGLLSFGLVVIILWYAQLVFRAEVAFFSSLKAFAANDGEKTYLLQQQAIAINPYKDDYRTAYAQTNFAIAQALSAQAAETELSEEQKQVITQLLQQALEQARLATQLNPDSSNNWGMMAALYANLIGSIEQADQWAVASYVKAIETNPNNPLLRIQLGTIFYQAKNYDQAAQLFAQAIQLKPDLQSAYYNLAKTLDEGGNTDQAISAYQQLLTLIDPQSDEYTQVEKELSTVLEKAKKAKEDQEAAEVATTPQEVELPQEIKDEAQVLEQEPPVLEAPASEEPQNSDEQN